MKRDEKVNLKGLKLYYLIKFWDSSGKNLIYFWDFLNMILPKANTDLRTSACQRPYQDSYLSANSDTGISENAKECLARILERLI